MEVKRGTTVPPCCNPKVNNSQKKRHFFVKCLLKQQADYITLGSFQTKKVHSGVASSLGQY